MGRMKSGKWEYTEEELNEQLSAAENRGEEADRTEARARSARYNKKTGLIIVDLVGGTQLKLSPEKIQGLGKAPADSLADVRVMPGGSALHWRKLNVGHTVAGLAAGLFGSRAWMSALARKGGSTRSEAKTRAARANGLKGGRPKKRSTQEVNNPGPKPRNSEGLVSKRYQITMLDGPTISMAENEGFAGEAPTSDMIMRRRILRGPNRVRMPVQEGGNEPIASAA